MSIDWIDVDKAAEHLGISQSKLYSLAQHGRIPAHRVGKQWRFNRAELDTWVKAARPIHEFFKSVDAAIDGNDLLRDPQRESHTACANFFDRGGRTAIVQLPVGCGKTGVISVLPFGIAEGRVLVIAPNVTIRSELARALDITNRRFCFWRKCEVLSEETMSAGPYVAVIDGTDANIEDCNRSHIVLTNIQQLASSADRWLPEFPDNFFDLILVDEGHHSAAASWKKVFDRFPNAKVVNLTATPFRSDNKDIEGELVYRYSFKRAMIKGYIKKLQAIYVAPEEIYFTYKGDAHRHTLDEVLQLKEETWFSRGVALAKECNKHIVDASLDSLERLRQSGTEHQLIAVAMTVPHAKEVRSLYSERGLRVEAIYSSLPDETKADIIQKLKSGLLDCIVQVQMLGEGFDHPKLSVAAIFRPFRSLSPYVQFVGRIMRVVVQNDARHPDNYGYVVTHVGLNLDRQLADFRDLERDDQLFFQNLMSGAEPEPPESVLRGDARMKLREDMVVKQEIISEFFEENFLDTEDQALLDELKAQAEALGFDATMIAEAVRGKSNRVRVVPAGQPFPTLPQKQRQEARRRLKEEVNRTAKLLLNRCELSMSGRELAFQYAPGRATGNNFAAAVQLINNEVNKSLGIKSGERGHLKYEDFVRGIDQLDIVLNALTRFLKARIANHEQERP
jgi:excisionase family DNA binding protein